MSILNINNLGQSFGDFDVFTGLNASIPHGAKIGLVGPNGIGKTSLLLILAGITQASRGSVYIAQGMQLGYLRQEAIEAFARRENTVYGEMLTVFAETQAQELRMRELEQLMGTNLSNELLEEYGDLQERFEHAGGYDYELRIEQTLDGLGFTKDHWTLPLSHLSGGQKTRALLARLLLEKPDLLILDEPTNHLDVEAIEWLENTLRAWEGALLVVSHDRYFLDEVVNTIWEMSRASMESYRGNYSSYLRQRQDRWNLNEKTHEQEMERLLKELDYVKRNIVRASTNGMAVGRLRRLSRDIIAIEELGFVGYQGKSWSETGIGAIRPLGVAEAEQRLKALPAPNNRPPKVGLRLKSSHRSGDMVLRTKDLTVGYPNAPLFDSDDIELHRGDVAALIGGNGTGKTTFLKTLLEQLEPLGGEVRFGASLKVGYFAQAHDDLNPENTVLDELLHYKDMPISQARNYLGQYLFRGDDVFKPISALSGGERARLALAMLALNGANLLLMDEPTNHLDIMAQEVLQEVMEHFDGTILLVSHDRYLVARLANQIWDLRDGRLNVFKGDYPEFVAKREAAKTPRKAKTASPQSHRDTELKAGSKKALAKLEAQISDAEKALERVTHQLEVASSAQKIAEIEQLGKEYETAQTRLDALLAEWTVLAAENDDYLANAKMALPETT